MTDTNSSLRPIGVEGHKKTRTHFSDALRVQRNVRVPVPRRDCRRKGVSRSDARLEEDSRSGRPATVTHLSQLLFETPGRGEIRVRLN